MSPSENPQHGNVGNTGDILKHAALLAVGNVLTTAQVPFHHVETHAFLLEAPVAAGEAWASEVETRTQTHPAYAPYRDLEQELVEQGRYLCSAGLMLAAHPTVRLHLAERDDATRARLEAQLEVRGARPARLLEDGLAFPSEAQGETRGTVLVHVDPFTDPAPFWPSAARAAEALRAPDAPVALLTFTYGARPTWPETLDAFGDLVGRIDEGPYHLAVWCDGVPEAARTLASLGWETACNLP